MFVFLFLFLVSVYLLFFFFFSYFSYLFFLFYFNCLRMYNIRSTVRSVLRSSVRSTVRPSKIAIVDACLLSTVWHFECSKHILLRMSNILLWCRTLFFECPEHWARFGTSNVRMVQGLVPFQSLVKISLSLYIYIYIYIICIYIYICFVYNDNCYTYIYIYTYAHYFFINSWQLECRRIVEHVYRSLF